MRCLGRHSAAPAVVYWRCPPARINVCPVTQPESDEARNSGYTSLKDAVDTCQRTNTGIDESLRSIEADLRNQYRMVYKPAGLKHDGSFRAIQLEGPARAEKIVVRSGYYAPAR
jgi:hypothetical protein